MRPTRFALLVAALVLVSCALFQLKPKFSRAQTDGGSSTPCCGQPDTTAPREIDFPYYSLRDGFNSSVLLVSDSPKPLDFVMAIRSRSGQTVLAPSMTIQPQEKLSIDVRKVLTDAAADVLGDFSEGSVSVYFNGTIMPLPAQLTISNPARSLIMESEMVDNTPGAWLLPKTLSALWWGIGGGRDARIIVSNTSGETVVADIFLDFLGGRHASDPLSFAPHETKVLSIAELLGDLKVSPAQAPAGGITIVSRGPKASLIAQGKITDPLTGFSTSLNFPDPSLQLASALHASGVPIGKPTSDSPYAGTGTFVPHVIARNLTGSPQSVTITIEYPGQKEPEQLTLPPFPLGGYATNDIALDSVFDQLPLPLPYCSIRIQYSGAPGSVVAEVTSVEQKGDLVIDSRLANEGDGWAGSGGHPWHLDDETESILFLTNMGEKECPIGFQMAASGVHYYLTELRLKPHETRALDLRKLRDAQEPDFRGTKIPVAATDGTVLWVRAGLVPVMGRLVVLQRHKGMASNYDCGSCPCPTGLTSIALTMCHSTENVLPLGTHTCHATATYRDCNWQYSYIDVRLAYATNWSSSVPAVATIDNTNTSSKGLLKGWTGGTSNISVSFMDYEYSYNPFVPPYCFASQVNTGGGAPARVRVTKWAAVTGDSGDQAYTCLNSTRTVQRNREYWAYDDFGKIPFTQTWRLNETVTSPTNCEMTTDGTDSVVNFIDTINNCKAGCTFESNQSFTITPPQGTAINVKAKNCVGKTEAQCISQSQHNGWHVNATTSAIAVTDN